MPGLDPGIHVIVSARRRKSWMAGTRPAMTRGETQPRTAALIAAKSIFFMVRIKRALGFFAVGGLR
jgi:hypothetical protein